MPKASYGLVVAFWHQPSMLNMVAAPLIAARLLVLSFAIAIAVVVVVAAVVVS